MPTFRPISALVPIKASLSDLVDFRWNTEGISADFIIPDDDAHLLRVSFDKPCIVRLLDEMPLSTEDDDAPNEGLVSENFAYSVVGAAFSRAQSDAWKTVFPSVSHYRFITGWGCMDVLSSATPAFTLVMRTGMPRSESGGRRAVGFLARFSSSVALITGIVLPISPSLYAIAVYGHRCFGPIAGGLEKSSGACLATVGALAPFAAFFGGLAHDEELAPNMWPGIFATALLLGIIISAYRFFMRRRSAATP